LKSLAAKIAVELAFALTADAIFLPCEKHLMIPFFSPYLYNTSSRMNCHDILQICVDTRLRSRMIYLSAKSSVTRTALIGHGSVKYGLLSFRAYSSC
jgi:hypothetical protein